MEELLELHRRSCDEEERRTSWYKYDEPFLPLCDRLENQCTWLVKEGLHVVLVFGGVYAIGNRSCVEWNLRVGAVNDLLDISICCKG